MSTKSSAIQSAKPYQQQFEQALQMAKKIPDPGERDSTLKKIAKNLFDDKRDFKWFGDVVNSFSDKEKTSNTLGVYAEHLALFTHQPSDYDEALYLANLMKENTTPEKLNKMNAFVVIETCHHSQSTLDKLLAIIKTIPKDATNNASVGKVLKRVAINRAEGKDFDQAIKLANMIPDQQKKSKALKKISLANLN